MEGSRDPREIIVSQIVGVSPAIQEARKTLLRLVENSVTVLFVGESGTGKSLFAQVLHKAGPRRARRFVVVNCSAVPETLFESEMFGYEKGAFTGAHAQRIGNFEKADGGTILLDEIGELARSLQPKLLTVLESKEFDRLGGRTPVKVDIRIIAATNKDLARAVLDGTFRQDLYHRLNVVKVEIPPLRERPEDIPALLESLVPRLCAELKIQRKRIAPEAIKELQEHSWLGNVRELENTLTRTISLCESEDIKRGDWRLDKSLENPNPSGNAVSHSGQG